MSFYSKGWFDFSYDLQKYNFDIVITEFFNRYAEKNNLDKIDSLGELHLLGLQGVSQENLRQIMFEAFRSKTFQSLYKSFGKEIIDRYFDKYAYLQKTPTARVQFPHSESTSFHTDAWYGHGVNVKSFWVPLVNVGIGSTLSIVKSKSLSIKLIKKITKEKLDLEQINNLAGEASSPFIGNLGDVLTFDSETLHGAKKSLWDSSRVSFDFRISPDNNLGSKPKSNFFLYSELSKKEKDYNQSSTLNEKTTNLLGISYSNNNFNVTSKAQLMLCNSYAKDSNIPIVGNEAEIDALDHMPVLRNLITNSFNNSNCILVFGIEIFKSKSQAIEILKLSEKNNTTIIFCAQGIHFTSLDESSEIMQFI